MGMHYDDSSLHLVLGAREKPVLTPKGITVFMNDNPKGAWTSLNLSCDDDPRAASGYRGSRYDA